MAPHNNSPIEKPYLPQDRSLDIAALLQVFNHTNNSYKFLWTLALLESLPLPDKSPSLQIPMKTVLVGMLKHAKYPIRKYLLSFGVWDRMNDFLSDDDDGNENDLVKALNSKEPPSKLPENEAMALSKTCKELAQYVPQQWLVPFLSRHEKMPKGSTATAKVIREEFAQKYFKSKNPPPYRFIENCDKDIPFDIKFHRKWHAYLWENQGIIKGWTLYHWINYLQKRNPSTPGIITKIIHPEKRLALTKEKNWWKSVIQDLGGNICCIYSGQSLTAEDNFELDHYVPWSFVGHNRLWNLVPTAKDININKSDKLPSDIYLEKLIKLQHKAISTERRTASNWKRQEMLNAYVEDLRINLNKPPSLKHVREAYSEIIPPLISIATSQGFKTDWKNVKLKYPTLL